MDAIGSIFLGMYILGRRVRPYAFYFIVHFRLKAIDESLNDMYIRMQRHLVGNLAMNLSTLEVWIRNLTRNLDQAHQNSIWRARKKKKKTADIRPAKRCA